MRDGDSSWLCRDCVSVGWLSDAFQDPLNHLVHVDAFGIGVEIGEEAVAEYWVGDSPDVFCGHREATVENRPSLGSEDHILGCTGTGSPGQPILDEVR